MQDLTVCQASASFHNLRERLNTLEDYVQLTGKEVTKLASKFERQTIADGKIIIPAKVVKDIQALCFGAREWTCAGHQLDANEFTSHLLPLLKQKKPCIFEMSPNPNPPQLD